MLLSLIAKLGKSEKQKTIVFYAVTQNWVMFLRMTVSPTEPLKNFYHFYKAKVLSVDSESWIFFVRLGTIQRGEGMAYQRICINGTAAF